MLKMSRSIRQLFQDFMNIGLRPDYLPWEVSLTRKLNVISLIGFINVVSAFIIYELFQYSYFRYECLGVIVAAPFVIILNKRFGYISAAYLFNIIGFVFFAFLNLKMGKESFMFLFYFSMMISLVQLLARRETLIHMIIMFLLCFVSILSVIIGFYNDWLYIPHSPETIKLMQLLNMIFSTIVTISFIATITMESIKQERIIKNMLGEKEVLLAEVFHRVKNNMNIVTSLLNLKKNSSESETVKQALEECKNRVYSMALVHQNIYKTNDFTNLDMKDYIHDLVDELLDSNGFTDTTEALVKCDDVSFDLARAVPFGLILNELITNSFKYARTAGRNLRLEIILTRHEKEINFHFTDNGPGLSNAIDTKNKLGLELIRSLSDQLDATHSFKNDKGLMFDLNFRLN